MSITSWEFPNNSQQKCLKEELEGEQTIAMCYGSDQSLGNILQRSVTKYLFIIISQLLDMVCVNASDLKGAKYSCLEVKSMCVMITIEKT